jgi:hypothetical protein
MQTGFALAETPKASTLSCDPGDTGIWAPLDSSNHDNLIQLPDRSQVAPGDLVNLKLQWEWRDWEPGAKLQLRACTDIDPPAEADQKATPPHDGPQADFSATHPEQAPETRGGTKDRRVVNHTIALQVPKGSQGEFCTRVAVMGDSKDHRGTSPTFDIAETICLPIVGAPPPSSPSTVGTPSTSPPGAPSAPASAPMVAPSHKPARHPKSLPVTGGVDIRLMGLMVGLLGIGIFLERKGEEGQRKRRSSSVSLKPPLAFP